MKKSQFPILFIAAIISIAVNILVVNVAGAGSGGGGYRSTPACTEDVWTCSAWGACQPEGTQTRSCTLSVDCAAASTPRPAETAPCAYVSELLTKLKCANLPTVQDRVRCRLRLSEAELTKEIQIQFLPEECRTIQNIAKKETCVNRYASVQKCWKQKDGERVDCAKKSLGVGDIAKQTKDCRGNQACLNDVQGRVYQLIKWRFYNLEERAEKMLEEGKASEDQVTFFIADIETKKEEFNEAKTKMERRQIILAVRVRWQQFLKEVFEEASA